MKLVTFFASAVGFMLATTLYILSGCFSGTSAIAQNSTASRTAATTTTSRSNEILSDTSTIRSESAATRADLGLALATPDLPDAARPPIESATTRQVTINTAALSIEDKVAIILANQRLIVARQDATTEALTSVQDRESSLLKALRLIAWIIAPIAILVLLWYTGAGLLIKKLFWAAGLLIPHNATVSAKFDVEAIESGVASAARREAVAARRAGDPAYNAAFEQEKITLRMRSPAPAKASVQSPAPPSPTTTSPTP